MYRRVKLSIYDQELSHPGHSVMCEHDYDNSKKKKKDFSWLNIEDSKPQFINSILFPRSSKKDSFVYK